MRRFIAITVILAAFPGISLAAIVIDGDTIIQDGEHIRLKDIDAPEREQACIEKGSNRSYQCGEQSKQALFNLVKGSQVNCIIDGKDKYHRWLGYCYTGNNDLGAEMIKLGQAVAYRESGKYLSLQNEAKATRKGLWNSKFELPWQWRKANRSK